MKRSHPRPLLLAATALAGVLACSGEAQVIGTPEVSPSGGGPGEPTTGEPTTPPGMGEPAPGPGEGRQPPPVSAPEGAGEPGADPPGEELPSDMSASDPIDAEVTFVAPRGACARESRVGAFSIEKQVDFGVVQGAVSDGVVPTAIPSLALEDGACRLLERRNLACIPACVGAETCGEGGTCIPYPRQVSVGEVSISGLTQETRMSPLAPGNTYFAPGADNPPYEVGSEIVLRAAGDGERAAFQLFGWGSEPLAEAPRWQLAAGEDLSIEWQAPTADVQTTVLIELTIDQHGSSPLSLACEFADTGSAVVPAALVDRMIDSGVSGFPNGRLTRRTADHVDLGSGCVELVVGSPLSASITVAGYTPCNGSGECPSGQTCNVALQRCE